MKGSGLTLDVTSVNPGEDTIKDTAGQLAPFPFVTCAYG